MHFCQILEPFLTNGSLARDFSELLGEIVDAWRNTRGESLVVTIPNSMLLSAHRHYAGHVPLVRVDAQSLLFKDDSFNVVVLFETLYNLARPHEFLGECRRVLRRNGTLLMCSANREWKDFSSSALSAAPELRELLAENHFDSKIFDGFPASADSFSEKIIQAVRGLAVRLNLILRMMRGKEFLKQIFFGCLIRLGAAVEENTAENEPLILVLTDRRTSPQYKGRARPKSATRLETQWALIPPPLELCPTAEVAISAQIDIHSVVLKPLLAYDTASVTPYGLPARVNNSSATRGCRAPQFVWLF